MKTDDYCWNIADFRKAISLWLNFVFWWICRILLISQCWTIIWRHSWQNCILDSYSGWIFANPHQTSWLDCWLLSKDHSLVIVEANILQNVDCWTMEICWTTLKNAEYGWLLNVCCSICWTKNAHLIPLLILFALPQTLFLYWFAFWSLVKQLTVGLQVLVHLPLLRRLQNWSLLYLQIIA